MRAKLARTAVIVALVVPASVAGQIPSEERLDFSCTGFPTEVSHADLVERFGPDNVVEAPLEWSGEYRGDGTVLFPNSPDARLEIIWEDQEQRRNPGAITARAGHSERWQAPNGVSVGMDLRSLERANGGPFRLAGFQTQLMGKVRSWAGGNLELPESDGCRVTIRLQPSYDERIQNYALFRQVRSGREYSSGHLAMQTLNPRVASMVIYSYGPIR